MFKAKVSSSNSTFHLWEPSESHALFVAICNPGLTRAKTELHDTKNKDSICKVCAQHKPANHDMPEMQTRSL